jgi:hypothetical protein
MHSCTAQCPNRRGAFVDAVLAYLIEPSTSP